MKVLLVNTNRMKPAIAPVGLEYVAESIRAAGYELAFLDLCFSNDIKSDINRTVKSFNPDIIGVTVRNTDDCYYSGGSFFLPEIKSIVQELKNASDAPVVIGGVGFSISPEHVMEYCNADYGIAGEGEEAFVILLSALKNGISLSRVPNLLYREDGKIRKNSMAYADLDSIPPRRRDIADNILYFNEGGQAGIETKRGCNMQCIYCADPVSKGRHIRVRSPKLVVEELKALLKQGIDHFHTCDCEFNIPGEHAKDVCRAIIDAKIGDKIRWYAYCSVTPFDEEMADLFVRSGCAGVDFGADSGDDGMLQKLERHYNSQDLEKTAKICHKFKLPFMYDLLIGAPGETRESVRRTIELMKKINADCVGLSMGVRIYEGTELAAQMRRFGDVSSNPDIYGAKCENPHLLRPVFYISPELGEGIVDYVRELVDNDKRFFLPSNEEAESNYNYNDNTVLVNAIRNGARGAYWDILRRLQQL